METFHMENNEENNISQELDEVNKDLRSSREKILEFRDHLLAREILSCGVQAGDNVVHFGSGYNNGLLYRYFAELNKNESFKDLNLNYVAVDADEESHKKMQEMQLENPVSFDIDYRNISVQEFLDETQDIPIDWTIITGIFDKYLYEEKQFDFINTIVTKCLELSGEGLIFTFDSSKEVSSEYTIDHIAAYVRGVFGRYRINKINEENYVICIYKYYHSLIIED